MPFHSPASPRNSGWSLARRARAWALAWNARNAGSVANWLYWPGPASSTRMGLSVAAWSLSNSTGGGGSAMESPHCRRESTTSMERPSVVAITISPEFARSSPTEPLPATRWRLRVGAFTRFTMMSANFGCVSTGTVHSIL